jgi:hypothetical protein
MHPPSSRLLRMSQQVHRTPISHEKYMGVSHSFSIADAFPKIVKDLRLRVSPDNEITHISSDCSLWNMLSRHLAHTVVISAHAFLHLSSNIKIGSALSNR